MDESQNTLVNSHNVDIRPMQNGTKPKKLSIDEIEDCFVPPDGGARAWIVMVCSFFCNGILFGIINSSGVFHQEFSSYLETVNDTEASRKAGKYRKSILLRRPLRKRIEKLVNIGTYHKNRLLHHKIAAWGEFDNIKTNCQLTSMRKHVPLAAFISWDKTNWLRVKKKSHWQHQKYWFFLNRTRSTLI